MSGETSARGRNDRVGTCGQNAAGRFSLEASPIRVHNDKPFPAYRQRADV